MKYLMMKTFMIQFDYENGNRECFVQQLDARPDEIFLLTFKDSCLIQRFKGKRMLVSQQDISEDVDTVLRKAWSAIKQKMQSS